MEVLGPPGLYGLEVSVEQRQPIEDAAQNGRSAQSSSVTCAMVPPRCARRKYLRAVYDVHRAEENLGLKQNSPSSLEINRQLFFRREFTQRLYAQLARHPRLCLRAEVNCPSYFICKLVVDRVNSVSNLK